VFEHKFDFCSTAVRTAFETPLYQTIEGAQKFHTLFLMNRIWPLLLLGACTTVPVTPAAAPPGGRIVELRQATTCPEPASRALVTIPREGKIERVIFDGLEFEMNKTKSSREELALAPKDVADVFRAVEDSDWRSIDEQPTDAALKGSLSCPTCCTGALLIKTTEGNRSLGYAAESKPKKLEALLKKIDAILARGKWTRVFLPWERQR